MTSAKPHSDANLVPEDLPERTSVQGTIQRAASVLRALEAGPWGMSLSQIALATNLPRSTVHRLIKTLQTEQLVASVSGSQGYRLGAAFVRVAVSVNNWLAAWMRPELLRLSQTVGETVDLSFLVGRQMTFVDQVVVPHRLQAVSAVGMQLPLHCTASGKSLLAALKDSEVIKTIERPLQGYTPNTVTDENKLLAVLAEARKTHVAFDNEEHHAGVSGVATCLAGPFGGRASIGIPVPTARFLGRERDLSRSLLQTSARLHRLIDQKGDRSEGSSMAL